MAKDRPNKIPTPKTIARRYSEGWYCDYPADTVLGAVNSFDYDYNPTAIPIQIGFSQMFVANFNVFVYLCDHKDDIDMDSFLADPVGYMENVGVELKAPLNDITSQIMVSMLEEDMMAALRSSDQMSVCDLIYSGDKESWPHRHPERYDRTFMKRRDFYDFRVVPGQLNVEELESAGFNHHMSISILFIQDFFAAAK